MAIADVGCSLTLAWVYREENTTAIREVLTRIMDRGAWVPGPEPEAAPTAASRAGRRGSSESAARSLCAWNATLRLPGRHNLTLYDAAYLELAQRRGIPLATLDRELRAAAAAEGMVLLGMEAG